MDEILSHKILVIQKYMDLAIYPQEFIWTENELSDYPYRKLILKFLKLNTKFEFTKEGIIIYENICKINN